VEPFDEAAVVDWTVVVVSVVDLVDVSVLEWAVVVVSVANSVVVVDWG
jgi:hypothetical protein